MRKKISVFIGFAALSLLVFVSACSNAANDLPSEPFTNFQTETNIGDLFEIEDAVSITRSTLAWETYQFALSDNNTILAGSYDGKTKTAQTFTTWVLENRYLKVTLLPEYGGRILSMIYKPTGHEALYQNPVGVPYQIGTKVFYHDWLMVYGGIFPTFPEPEHGKYWFLPWDFEIIKETDKEVVVSMSRVDDLENPLAPSQYNLGSTGLRVTYIVSLKAGRAALDTRVVIENTGTDSVVYEYWTNTTLAPGSDPDDPKTTSGAEIIAPVKMIKIPDYWQGIAAQEKSAGLIAVYDFQVLRLFENWTDMGIAYAFPDMGDANFWGVINHDNQEGIFRIADNTITPGMKIWTWGYPQTAALDPLETVNEARPYIEIWAGVTREFWQRTELPSNQQVEIWETYSPSVGLNNVTNANHNFLVNCAQWDADLVDCQIFGMYPDQTVRVTLLVDNAEIYSNSLTLDPKMGNNFSAPFPVGEETDGAYRLVVSDLSGNELFSDTIALTITD